MVQYKLDSVDNHAAQIEVSTISITSNQAADSSSATAIDFSSYQLFSIQFEDDGQHTVTINSLGSDTLYLDYFLADSSNVSKSLGIKIDTRSSSSGDGEAKYGITIGCIIGAFGLLLSLLLWNYRSKRLENQNINIFEPDPFNIIDGK
jgi:hypothetical protein